MLIRCNRSDFRSDPHWSCISWWERHKDGKDTAPNSVEPALCWGRWIEQLVFSWWSLCSARGGGSMAVSRAPDRARRLLRIERLKTHDTAMTIFLIFCTFDPWVWCLFPFRPQNFHLSILTLDFAPKLLIMQFSPYDLYKYYITQKDSKMTRIHNKN